MTEVLAAVHPGELYPDKVVHAPDAVEAFAEIPVGTFAWEPYVAEGMLRLEALVPVQRMTETGSLCLRPNTWYPTGPWTIGVGENPDSVPPVVEHPLVWTVKVVEVGFEHPGVAEPQTVPVFCSPFKHEVFCKPKNSTVSPT